MRISRTRLAVLGLVALGAAVAILALTQLGSAPAAPASVARPWIEGEVGAGQPLHARVGRWHHEPASYSYQWQACPTGGACTDIRGATSPSFAPALTDRARSFRVRVSARNQVGTTSAWSVRTAVLAAADPGAPGPDVTCTQTLDAGADLQTDLARADPGEVICLHAGDWGDVTLSQIAPGANVTLAAAPGQSVHVGTLTIEGQSESRTPTDNLTVRGLWIDGGVADLTDTTGGLVFAHDTISHVPRGYGFYFNSDGNGGSHAQSGVVIRDDRIDHVGECLAITGTAKDFTFSHNVCGPGVGYQDTDSTQPSHYIEVGHIDGLAITGNRFEGPADPNSDAADLHLNVLHLFGGASHVDFSGNVLWHTQARGQALLIQEGQFDDITIDGNLDVEDPACTQHSGCANYMAEVSAVHGLSFVGNTVIGAAYGVLLTQSDESGDYPSGRDYVITHNIVVGEDGAPAISYGECADSCRFDDNVTDDDSAAQANAPHSVTQWVPAWRPGTTYEPDGLPFAAGWSAAGNGDTSTSSTDTATATTTASGDSATPSGGAAAPASTTTPR